jgi:hypothetical protein
MTNYKRGLYSSARYPVSYGSNPYYFNGTDWYEVVNGSRKTEPVYPSIEYYEPFSPLIPGTPIKVELEIPLTPGSIVETEDGRQWIRASRADKPDIGSVWWTVSPGTISPPAYMTNLGGVGYKITKVILTAA